MHRILGLFILVFMPFRTVAFQTTDSLEVELSEVIVVGYEGNRSIMETPASISTIKTERLHLFDKTSLLSGMNTLPGIRMEERAAGSYRISIRGSSLRSPFGVRNVKVYWNGIPFTEPTGSTFLNLLDLNSITKMEIIKGPAGSMYGAGNGGVILMDSFQPLNTSRLTAETNTGSFGQIYYSGSYTHKMESGQLQYRYARRDFDGYRNQNFFKQHTAEVSGKFFLDDKSFLQVNALYTDLDYGIPGGLTETEFENNPRQSRPGAAANHSGIKQESLILGVSLNQEVGPNLIFVQSAFASMSSFDNPYLFDYKKDGRKSGGYRSRFIYNTGIVGVDTKLIAGSEVQVGHTAARNYGIDAGRVDGLNFDDEIKITGASFFGSAELDLKHDFYLTLGASLNTLKYNFDRLETHVAGDTTGLSRKRFNPQLVPRIGLLKKLGNSASIYGSVSFGFSPPTVEEVRTNEGSLNLGLSAEKGTNYELGFRGNLFNTRVNYDAVFFYLGLNNAIVQQQTPRGTPAFRNAGSADLIGFELSTRFVLLSRPGELISGLDLDNALTFNHFRFDKYNTASGDYSGNELTGVSPLTSSTTLTLRTNRGFYVGLSHYYSDKMALNDGNTIYSDSWNLVKATAGYLVQLRSGFGFELSYTLDNALDESYSLGYDINAFGGRYYQPAASRNWLAGAKFNYDF